MDIYMRSVDQNEQLIPYFKMHPTHAPLIILIDVAFVDAFAVGGSSLFILASQGQYKPVPLILHNTRNIKNAVNAIVSIDILNSHIIFMFSGAFHGH